MSDEIRPWFAVHVRSRQEKVVGRSLTGKGLTVFVPLYRSRRQWTDRVEQIEMPLFPGYLFCRLDPNYRLPVLQTKGVVSVIGDSRGPIPVSELEVANIQRVTRSGEPITPWGFLQTGQRVRIVSGSLTGVEGVLIRVKNEYRVVVSTALLQRSISVEVDRDALSPVR